MSHGIPPIYTGRENHDTAKHRGAEMSCSECDYNIGTMKIDEKLVIYCVWDREYKEKVPFKSCPKDTSKIIKHAVRDKRPFLYCGTCVTKQCHKNPPQNGRIDLGLFRGDNACVRHSDFNNYYGDKERLCYNQTRCNSFSRTCHKFCFRYNLWNTMENLFDWVRK